MADLKGKPGRPPGSINKDKAELRALLQEKVHEFTQMRRAQDLANLPPDLSEEEAIRRGLVQEIVDEYDPVVALAITANDGRVTLDQRIKCNAEVAQYVRPKLKSVEVTADPEALETLEQRRQLSERLVGLLEAAASAKKDKAERKKPLGGPPPPAEPES